MHVGTAKALFYVIMHKVYYGGDTICMTIFFIDEPTVATSGGIGTVESLF